MHRAVPRPHPCFQGWSHTPVSGEDLERPELELLCNPTRDDLSNRIEEHYGAEATKASVGPFATGGVPDWMKNGSKAAPRVVIPM